MRDEEEGEGEGERGRIQQESKGERCDEEKGGTQRGGRGGGGWREQRRERNTGHIGSNSGIHLATPQILQSCWTSCTLHNRIRMNRPLPPSPPPPPSSPSSPPPTVLFSLRAAFTLPCPHRATPRPTHTPRPRSLSTPDNLRLSFPNQPLSLQAPLLSPSLPPETLHLHHHHHPRIRQTPPAGNCLSFLPFLPSSPTPPPGKSNLLAIPSLHPSTSRFPSPFELYKVFTIFRGSLRLETDHHHHHETTTITPSSAERAGARPGG